MAMEHLPAKESTPAQVRRLSAWSPRRRGDVESERRALESLIAAEPATSPPTTGWPTWRPSGPACRCRASFDASGPRSTSSKLDIKHGSTNQPRRDAAEMARLADDSAADFEARAFLTVAIAVDPERDDLRPTSPGSRAACRARSPKKTVRLAAAVAAAALECSAAVSAAIWNGGRDGRTTSIQPMDRSR